MSLPLGTKRGGEWVPYVAGLSIILGMLIAASFKTTQNIVKSGLGSNRPNSVTIAYLSEKSKVVNLQKQLEDERVKFEDLKKTIGSGNAEMTILQNDLTRYRLASGFAEAEGEGVEVVLQDYSGRIPKDLEVILQEQYIIHDVDLRDVINELYVNGAEVISIKSEDTEQRLISSSSIRCTGGVIQVNKIGMSSPFTIKAIGPPSAMEKGLTMTGGLIDNWRAIPDLAPKMVSVKRSKKLTIPAYKGDLSTLYIFTSDPKKEAR